MALEAQGAHVGEIALATAFGDGEDVIGVPEMPATAPFLFELAARLEIQLALVFAKSFGVEAALGADAAVSCENPIAEITRIGAEPPFVDAGGTTECEAAAGDFDAAAATEAALALDPTAGLNAPGAHTRSS